LIIKTAIKQTTSSHIRRNKQTSDSHL